MIRTTDAMIKAANVQKLKEMRAGHVEAMAKAKAAGADFYVNFFKGCIAEVDSHIDHAMMLLRNPAA